MSDGSRFLKMGEQDLEMFPKIMHLYDHNNYMYTISY